MIDGDTISGPKQEIQQNPWTKRHKHIQMALQMKNRGTGIRTE